MKTIALAALAGVLFALGLVVSGMTTPVTAFLDFTGAWDPQLAFVMADAIASLARDRIDARLIGGSAIFGIGWGLSGYCPGPALVSAGSARVEVVVFVGTLLLGTLTTRIAAARKQPQRAAVE